MMSLESLKYISKRRSLSHFSRTRVPPRLAMVGAEVQDDRWLLSAAAPSSRGFFPCLRLLTKQFPA